MRTTSVTVMVVFRKCHSENYFITATFKVLSQQVRGTLTTAYSKTYFNSFIKRKLKKLPESYKLHKNKSLPFEKRCSKTDHILLIFIGFFFF